MVTLKHESIVTVPVHANRGNSTDHTGSESYNVASSARIARDSVRQSCKHLHNRLCTVENAGHKLRNKGYTTFTTETTTQRTCRLAKLAAENTTTPPTIRLLT